MARQYSISRLTIEGFKSICKLDRLELREMNVLIGPNGSGKSNFVSYFRMLGEMMALRLQSWTQKQGTADRIVSFGVKETRYLRSFVEFGFNGYGFDLEPTLDGSFVFMDESLFFDGSYGKKWIPLGKGHAESELKNQAEKNRGKIADYCYSSISSWKVFHFHDTSETAGVKRVGALHDNEYLRPDASNLAAFLFKLSDEYPDIYQQIVKTTQLAIPFFEDFVLKPMHLKTEEKLIRLLWRQKNSDYALWPSQLSDGSIRFICLVTALLQPDPPSTIIIDEPELGLHPYAITLLGSLLKAASKQMQVIVSTQSVQLINEFSIDDLIVVERENGESVFRRYEEKEFESWLENYSVGELWEKNLLGGRPSR